MPGKFFDQFLSAKKSPTRIIVRSNYKEYPQHMRILMHPGSCGRIHADMKGHIQWNRKGRW